MHEHLRFALVYVHSREFACLRLSWSGVFGSAETVTRKADQRIGTTPLNRIWPRLFVRVEYGNSSYYAQDYTISVRSWRILFKNLIDLSSMEYGLDVHTKIFWNRSWNLIDSTDLHPRCIFGEEACGETRFVHFLFQRLVAKNCDAYVKLFISLKCGKFCWIDVAQISEN